MRILSIHPSFILSFFIDKLCVVIPMTVSHLGKCLHREIAHDRAVGCVNTVLILAGRQTKKGAKSLRPSCYWEEGLVL